MDPQYPGAVDEIVNLGNHWNQEVLREHKEEIKELTTKISTAFATAYDYLAEGNDIYQQLCYESGVALSEESLNKASEEIVEKIFSGNFATIKRFFASAITPLGLVGYGQEITEGCKKRFILAGGNSENVSMVLNKVVLAAESKGHSLNLYYDPFAPDNLEIVVVPSLSVALLNSRTPGIEPKPGDSLIELYPANKEFDEAENDIEEAKTPVIVELEAKWDDLFALAHGQISKAKTLHNQLEEYYISAMNFEGIDQVAKELFAEIWSMAGFKEKLEQEN